MGREAARTARRRPTRMKSVGAHLSLALSLRYQHCPHLPIFAAPSPPNQKNLRDMRSLMQGRDVHVEPRRPALLVRVVVDVGGRRLALEDPWELGRRIELEALRRAGLQAPPVEVHEGRLQLEEVEGAALLELFQPRVADGQARGNPDRRHGHADAGRFVGGLAGFGWRPARVLHGDGDRDRVGLADLPRRRKQLLGELHVRALRRARQRRPHRHIYEVGKARAAVAALVLLQAELQRDGAAGVGLHERRDVRGGDVDLRGVRCELRGRDGVPIQEHADGALLRVAPRVLEVRHERLQPQGGGLRVAVHAVLRLRSEEAHAREARGLQPTPVHRVRRGPESAHPEEDGEARRLHLQAPALAARDGRLGAGHAPALVLLLHEGRRHVIEGAAHRRVAGLGVGHEDVAHEAQRVRVHGARAAELLPQREHVRAHFLQPLGAAQGFAQPAGGFRDGVQDVRIRDVVRRPAVAIQGSRVARKVPGAVPARDEPAARHLDHLEVHHLPAEGLAHLDELQEAHARQRLVAGRAPEPLVSAALAAEAHELRVAARQVLLRLIDGLRPDAPGLLHEL
mmetsp:Transcript_41287/g.129323  ORF Transcript_41287/g.129323 Transcript_41287/m.129323 type:complete len:569 (+) Transcript_41287:216-1922(+)